MTFRTVVGAGIATLFASLCVTLSITVCVTLCLPVDSARAQSGQWILIEHPQEGTVERVSVWHFGEVPYLAVEDVARLTESSLFWRSDVQKLILRNSRHSLKFSVDLNFAVIDEKQTIQLAHPVRQQIGVLYLPLSIMEDLLVGLLVYRFEKVVDRYQLVVEPANIAELRIQIDGSGTRLVLPFRTALPVGLLSTRGSRFVVRIVDGRLDPVAGDTLQRAGLIDRLRLRRKRDELWVELRLDPTVASYRFNRAPDGNRVEIEFSTSTVRDGFLPISAEFGPGKVPPIRVLTIDPGHGGSDSGYVSPSGVPEKDLTLAVALAVREELRKQAPSVRVILARSTDETLSAPARAEITNREHADLHLSLHFDGSDHLDAGGITAYIAPPLEESGELLLSEATAPATGTGRKRPISIAPWRQAAGRHHAEARAAAEHLLGSLAADGFGPSRMRIVATYPTQGVDAPAVLLECGTLSDAEERRRLSEPDGMRKLALSISRALVRYLNDETWP